jgi:hypothetical protein
MILGDEGLLAIAMMLPQNTTLQTLRCAQAVFFIHRQPCPATLGA